MKCSTFYFSGTGNTHWAAAEFTKIIQAQGHQAELFSIDIGSQLSDEQIRAIVADADAIGFANPIYGGDIPPIMRTFLSRVVGLIGPLPSPKTTYVINTYGYVNAFGPTETKKLLAGSGLTLSAYVNIQLCNNVTSSKPVDRARLSKRMVRGRQELHRLGDCLIAGHKRIKGHGPQLLVGAMIRKKVPEAIAKFYQTLGVDSATCTRCMDCVKNCPTGSIRLRGQRFVFSSGCTACMRCYNFCPTGAITIDGAVADPQKYPRFQGPEEWLNN
ncbi:EFR1 family ferrodoxin [Acetobacterium sp.]|uniref:EFR1 family ferrodoxin n=1 Tax=Acetobacterium sp. TaxID=1872094 RepID=UPI0035936512